MSLSFDMRKRRHIYVFTLLSYVSHNQVMIRNLLFENTLYLVSLVLWSEIVVIK